MARKGSSVWLTAFTPVQKNWNKQAPNIFQYLTLFYTLWYKLVRSVSEEYIWFDIPSSVRLQSLSDTLVSMSLSVLLPSGCCVGFISTFRAIPSFLPPIKLIRAQSYDCSFTECDPLQVQPCCEIPLSITPGTKVGGVTFVNARYYSSLPKKRELLWTRTSVINASHHSITSTLPGRHITDDYAHEAQSEPQARKL